MSLFDEPRKFAVAINKYMEEDGFAVIPMGSQQWAERVIAYIDHLRANVLLGLADQHKKKEVPENEHQTAEKT